MSPRGARWAGGVVAVAAVAGLVGYFLVVGLDKADKLGSAIGAVLGLAGVCLAIYGVVTGRPNQPEPPAGPEGAASPVASFRSLEPLASAAPSSGAGLGGVRNDIGGGVFHAPVIQSGSVGPVTFGPPVARSPQAEDTAPDPACGPEGRAGS